MNKKVILGAVLVVFALSVTFGGFATAPEVSYDNYTGRLSVSGEAKTGSFITFEILKPQKDYADLLGNDKSEAIFYANQTEAEKEKYLFELDFLGQTGNYKALVVRGEDGERSEFEIPLILSSDYIDAVKELNIAVGISYDEFERVLREKSFELGFSFDISATKEALNGFYDYVKQNGQKAENAKQNACIYKSYALMYAFKDGTATDVSIYINDIWFTDSVLEAEIKTFLNKNPEAGVYMGEKLKECSPKSLTDFEEELKIAYILGTIRYSNGYGDIVEVLTKYGSEEGITEAITSRACQKIGGGDYTKSSLARAYKTAYSENVGSGGLSGGSGGGSSSRVEISKTGINIIPITEELTESKKDGVFVDVSNEHWAYNSIEWLKNRKIANGNENGKFEPERAVKREEFTKMILLAAGLKPVDTEASFADAEENGWYVPYIEAALQKGIVNGIGGGIFGIGNNISRQDMAVMIKRTLEALEISCKKERDFVEFLDEDKIGNYAKSSIEYLFECGIINGKESAKFDPEGEATRAEAAKIIYEAFKEVEQDD